MTRGEPKNLAASVGARLRNLAREQRVESQLILAEFAMERLLYRLGASDHGKSFVLKGAMLFRLWSKDRGRATWDLDLLGRGADSVSELVGVFRDICTLPSHDGIVFQPDTVRGEEIRGADEYAGVRVRLVATLDGARVPLQVDIGFGDAVTPGVERVQYPTLLDHPAPDILVYPRPTVVAEKLEAMVSLGVTNTRMKDWYDLYVLASSFPFDGLVLAQAIRATFARRGTPLPTSLPLVLTPDFLASPERERQWRAVLRRGRLQAPPDSVVLANSLGSFVRPLLEAAGRGEAFDRYWPPGGPWR